MQLAHLDVGRMPLRRFPFFTLCGLIDTHGFLNLEQYRSYKLHWEGGLTEYKSVVHNVARHIQTSSADTKPFWSALAREMDRPGFLVDIYDNWLLPKQDWSPFQRFLEFFSGMTQQMMELDYLLWTQVCEEAQSLRGEDLLLARIVERFNSSISHAIDRLIARVGLETLQQQTPFGTCFLDVSRDSLTRLVQIVPFRRVVGAGVCASEDGQDWSQYMLARSLLRQDAIMRRTNLETTGLYYHTIALHMSAGNGMMVPHMRYHRDLGFTRQTILSRLLRKEYCSFPQCSSIRMVEIGVNKGSVAEILLEALPTLHWIGVDPYASHSKLDLENERYSDALLRLIKFSDRAHLLRQTSVQAAAWIQNSSFDLVFIDGMHEYASVAEDLQYWAPKLRSGGILAGHDYSMSCPGVVRAVHEFFVMNPPLDRTLHLGPDSTFFWHLVSKVRMT